MTPLSLARTSPHLAYPLWKKHLEQMKRSLEHQTLKSWKLALAHANRPTPALFRWLKGQPPQAPAGLDV